MARAVSQKKERERDARIAAESVGAAVAQSEQRLLVTVARIGEAVIATDERGLVTHMNPVAGR